MQPCRILLLGDLKGEYKRLADDFLKRLRKWVDLQVVKPKDASEIVAELKNSGWRVVVCDHRGKLLSFRELQGILDSRVVFVIGGKEGVPEDVKKVADAVVSFSPLVFNHQIFIIMLLDQLFRAYFPEHPYNR